MLAAALICTGYLCLVQRKFLLAFQWTKQQQRKNGLSTDIIMEGLQNNNVRSVEATQDDKHSCRISEDTMVLNVSHEHLFWWEGQPKLCQLIREKKNIQKLIDGRIQGPKVLVNMTIDCSLSFTGLGTGNYMVALYEAFMATSYSGVDFQFQCSQGTKDHHILKWFEGCYAANRSNWLPYNVTEEEICMWSMERIPLYVMGKEIQTGIRTMVRRAIGIDGPPPIATEIETPAFGKITFDETVIHFRCGDVLYLARPRSDYGIVKFKEYRTILSNATKTIGVLTQPFESKHNRPEDENRTQDCKRVVDSFISYLQRDFPNANITVRNNEQETLPLAYVRLAVATQSFIGLSSFSAFPLVGTYGEGIFQAGKRQVNTWLNRLPETMEHIKMANVDYITNRKIMIRGVNATILALNQQY